MQWCDVQGTLKWSAPQVIEISRENTRGCLRSRMVTTPISHGKTTGNRVSTGGESAQRVRNAVRLLLSNQTRL
jgi:hypothetical protein